MPKNQQTLTDFAVNGSLHDRLNAGLENGTFRGSQLKIATAIVENWSRAAWGPAARLCDAAGVDKASVSKFWERLGYKSLSEFQKAAQRVDGSAERHAFSSGLSFNLLTAIHLDHVASLRGIVSLSDGELYRLADQIRFSARELSRSSKITIIAATEVASHYVASVAHIFSNFVRQPVVVLHNMAQIIELDNKDGVVVLNVCCSPDEARDVVPSNYFGRCFHLVSGPMVVDGDNENRVLQCHNGTELFPNIAILLQVAVLIARAAGGSDSRE